MAGASKRSSSRSGGEKLGRRTPSKAAPRTTKKAAPKKAAPKKAAPKKAASKKAAPKKGAPKKAAPKKAAPKKAAPRPVSSTRIPVPSPSERVLASRSGHPVERELTPEERTAMGKVSESARRFVGADGTPSDIVGRIASFIEDVCVGRREEPKSQDIRLGIGVLWGDQVRAQAGWDWVHLSYPDGFASYAIVPDDRAFACFPLNRLPDALRARATSTSAHVFTSIREGSLPARRSNAYLVIG